MHTPDGEAQLYRLEPTVIAFPHLDAALRLAQRNTTEHEARLQDKSKTPSRIVEGALQEATDVPVLPTHWSEARITTDITPTRDLQLMDQG